MLLRNGISVLRGHLVARAAVAGAVSGRRYVQKDFHAPEWDFKNNRVLEAFREERDAETFRRRDNASDKFEYYDQVVWRPDYRYPDGAAKMGEVFHVAENVKHGPKKLFYACYLALGRSVDDADKQLQFIPRKSAVIVRDVIKEAVKKAVDEHGIEYRSNLWVAECFAMKSLVIKGVRRHARERWGDVEYVYSDVFVRLEEGQPPPYRTRDGRPPLPLQYGTGEEYVDFMRDRRIKHGL